MAQAVMIIVLINLALYFKTLRFKFVSDDFSVFMNPPEFKGWWHTRWLQFIGACKLRHRSILFVGGKIKVLFTEELEHLLALVLHIGICVAIYFAFGKNHVSLVAALLYSTNPVNNQGTIWCGGRGYALPILSTLLSICVPILAPLFLTFGTWFTVGFLGPLALIGFTDWYMIIWFLPFAWLINMKKWSKAVKFKSDTESFTEDRLIHPKKLILLVKTYGFYLALCLIPFKITFYHNFLQSMSGNEIMMKRAYKLDRYFLIGLVAGLGTIWFAWAHWGLFAWSLIAFMVAVAPFCNLIRTNQEIAERFVAYPNVFLMFALAQLIGDYPVIVSAFLAFYATRTFYTLAMYQDEYFITEVAVIEDNRSWWAWHCRAMKRWDTGSHNEALILWTMAKLISPKEFKVLMNMASCLRLMKNDKEADEYLALAEANIVRGQEKEATKFIEDHRAGKLPILL